MQQTHSVITNQNCQPTFVTPPPYKCKLKQKSFYEGLTDGSPCEQTDIADDNNKYFYF